MGTLRSCRVLRVGIDRFLCRTRDVSRRRSCRIRSQRGRVLVAALMLVMGVVGACGEYVPGETPARQDPHVVVLLAADGPDAEETGSAPCSTAAPMACRTSNRTCKRTETSSARRRECGTPAGC